MTDTDVFIGHHCPHCRTTVGVMASVGGTPICPGCGGELQAASGGPDVKVLTNVICNSCGSQTGMMSVIGGEANCPTCGNRLA